MVGRLILANVVRRVHIFAFPGRNPMTPISARRARSLCVMLAASGAACAILSVPPPPPPATTNDRGYISQAVLATDIDSMFAMIERVHPNPYTIVSRDSVRRARDAIVAALPDSATSLTT